MQLPLCMQSLCLAGSVIGTFLLVNCSGAAAQQQPSLWDHNGSTMYLVASGQKREFAYEEPRAGMEEAGARKGSVLFSGVAKGNQYFGTAFIYNARCGTFQYHVNGPILDNYRRVVLRGQAPRVNTDCKIAGRFPDTLEFVLLTSPSTHASILKPFEGTWTNTPGVCKSNFEKQSDSGGAITTIKDDEIIVWFSYSWEGEKDHVYGACGVARGHALPNGSAVVDLDCDHPGHSQKGVSISRIDANRISYRSTTLYRCR